MTQSALDLYLYMGSSDKIIEWLESEGVKTEDEARSRLQGAARNNMMSFAAHIGGGGRGGSLAGTANASTRILEYFKKKEQKS